MLEAARALAAQGSGRVADLRELNAELGGRIPSWYVDLLATVPLCGFEISWGKKHLEFLDAAGMRRETLGTHQAEQIAAGGFVAICYDHLYYDTFFLKTPCETDPWVYQINHEDGEQGVAGRLSELFEEGRKYVERVREPGPPPKPHLIQLFCGKQLAAGQLGDSMKELKEKLPPDLPEVYKEWRVPMPLGDYDYELHIHGRRVASGVCPDFNFRKLRDHLRKVILEHAVELRTPAAGDLVLVAPGVAFEGAREEPKLAPGHFLVAVGGRWVHQGRVEPGRLLQFGVTIWGPADTEFQGLPARWIDEEDEERARAAGAEVITPEEVVRRTVERLRT